MDNLLQGVPHTCVYLDDILITGLTEKEHIANLREVLRWLNEAVLRLKLPKCSFLQDSVTYLGHHLSASGLEPVPEKVRAVVDAPKPTDQKQLQAFLGLLNYYGRFLPKLSTILAPLHELLHRDKPWCWHTAQETAFRKAKQLLQDASVLTFYDPSKVLTLSCDASPYGVAAVLSR